LFTFPTNFAAGDYPTLSGKVAAHLVRWSPDRALEQVSDPVLQDPVGRQPDRVSRYSRFCELYRSWASRISVTMRQTIDGELIRSLGAGWGPLRGDPA